MRRTLSWIVPARNEARHIGLLLADIQTTLADGDELIVVDGHSEDATAAVARGHGAVVLTAPPCRGGQLRQGAMWAGGDRLVFVHADSRLAGGRPLAEQLRQLSGACAHCFRLRIAAADQRFRLLEGLVSVRTVLLGLPYGDQGLILDRSLYERCGGFRPLPLMEDVDLVRRLRAHGGVKQLPTTIDTSARRWLRNGLICTSVQNATLLLRWFLGEPSTRLQADYYS